MLAAGRATWTWYSYPHALPEPLDLPTDTTSRGTGAGVKRRGPAPDAADENGPRPLPDRAHHSLATGSGHDQALKAVRQQGGEVRFGQGFVQRHRHIYGTSLSPLPKWRCSGVGPKGRAGNTRA